MSGFFKGNLTVDIKKLKEIAEIESGDIIEDVIITDINELRIVLK